MFTNFISLGSSCHMAESMSKYGLREWTGPFDWLITGSLDWVLYYIKNDFKGFLDKENLECWGESLVQFRDKRSGFIFLHDIEFPFKTHYVDLKLKYQKRIDRFMKAISQPTCFLRYLTSIDEIEYIAMNYEYISTVIKGGNIHNEIVFLIETDTDIVKSIPFRHYVMPCQSINETFPLWERLGAKFDDEKKFLEYCALNYDTVSMMKNLTFYYKKVSVRRKEEREHWAICLKRYQTLTKLIQYDFAELQIPKKIIIYGAGNIGRIFYQKINDRCNVKCFVDEEKRGEIDGVQIFRLNEIDYDQSVSFIVTATYDFEYIRKNIDAYFSGAKIISLDSLLEARFQ